MANPTEAGAPVEATAPPAVAMEAPAAVDPITQVSPVSLLYSIAPELCRVGNIADCPFVTFVLLLAAYLMKVESSA